MCQYFHRDFHNGPLRASLKPSLFCPLPFIPKIVKKKKKTKAHPEILRNSFPVSDLLSYPWENLTQPPSPLFPPPPTLAPLLYCGDCGESCHYRLFKMAAYRSSVLVKMCLFLALTFAIVNTKQLDDDIAKEKAAAEKENKYHAIDTAFLLVMMFLLIITVLTVWLFKVKRFRFLHETGVCMIYGGCYLGMIRWKFVLPILPACFDYTAL